MAPLSRPGVVVGTVPYMAPEQVRGEEADERSDVFALGVMLYELACGRRPFHGSSPGVICSAILRDAPPSISSVRGDVPPELERVVLRCLEKDKQARFPSARALGEALLVLDPGSDSLAAGPGDGSRLNVPPPAPTTPLLGREETLVAALERVRGGARLLTITGYGGTGKTRFAIELYRRLAPEYAAGAAFASLASVTAAPEPTSPRWSRAARGCSSSPPAARHSRSPPRRSSRCRRSTCRPRTTRSRPCARARRSRCSCSAPRR